MGKYSEENSYIQKKKYKENLAERKEVLAKWCKRSEKNNGKANKRNKVQDKMYLPARLTLTHFYTE